MSQEKEEVVLRVGELTDRAEFGRGIVRIDTKTMNRLAIREGDVVEMLGQRKTGAIAVRAYPVDVGLNIIRMDGISRRNAGVGIGETIKLGQHEAKEAQRVILAPVQKGIILQMSPELLKRNLFMRPVTKKDIVIPFPVVKQRRGSPFDDFMGINLEEIFFTPIPGETKLIVVSTVPEGIARITDATEIELKPQAVEIEDKEIPTLSYEDIGGLGDAIQKIREMVELPMRHPELFTKLGIDPPKGILLHGPPGTGKTLIAKAVANESNASFTVINGPEVISKWYGQSLPGDEDILVVEDGKLCRKPIAQVVDEGSAQSVPCFGPDGKVTFGRITDFLKHPFRGRLLRVRTASGRALRVTDYHSLFTIGPSGIRSVKTFELVPHESYIAILDPVRNANLAARLSNAGRIQPPPLPAEDILGSQLAGKAAVAHLLPAELEAALEGDIGWDKVISIEEVAEKPQWVYDISVEPCENFLTASGVFAHNSEANLRKIFEDAEKNAPAIIFIDEIDAIAPKREEVSGEVERRVVSQILTLMDGLKSRGKVIVIAATNRPNALDPALRRPGRFDREVEIGVPDEKGRKEVLQIHTRNMPLTEDVELGALARVTYGFVGADLEALCKEAAMAALRRNLPAISWKKLKELPKDVMDKLRVTKDDFQSALKLVEPSAMREVLIEMPNVHWADIGGLEEVKQSLQEVVEWPLKNAEAFARMGIRPPSGVLLYGPPGTGKTLLAKAVATESGANFISIRGPELLSKFVGESEKHVREVFRRAKQVAPAVIFFDEIDALAPRRGLEFGSHVTENVVSQILTEMSGVEELNNVVVIAATNRPDIVDPALMRPGRFDRQVLVPAPDEKARLEVFKIYTKAMPLDKPVSLPALAKATEGFTGADIEALVREAGLNALREDMKAKAVAKKHFDAALRRAAPSVNAEVQKAYESMATEMKRPVEKKAQAPGYVG